jgi:hypothetical protein
MEELKNHLPSERVDKVFVSDGSYFLPSGGNKENLKDLISQPIILSSFFSTSKFVIERSIQEELCGECYRKCFQTHEG